MLGEDRLQRIAASAIDSSAANETDVVITSQESALTRFANSTVHQNVWDSMVEIRVRAIVGLRTGVASTNQLDDRAIVATVARAVDAARFAPEDPEFRGLPKPRPIPPALAFSSATADYSPERRARDVKAICDCALAHGLNASGAWSTETMEIAVANSHGVWAYAPRTHASLKSVIMGEDSSGYAERTGVDASAIDVDAVAQEAVAKALQSRAPV